MKILFVADARSPIALNWIKYFTQRGDDVYLASTFYCEPELQIKGLEFTPVAFSSIKKQTQRLSATSSFTPSLRAAIRHYLGPITIPRAAKKLRTFINKVQPDIIHAFRIPYEGMLTAYALGIDTARKTNTRLLNQQIISKPKFITSIWGNDFTLHAPSTPLMRYFTRKTMQTVTALHADCQRDIKLASQWGFDSSKPTLVTPGNGGIHTDIFYPPAQPVTEPIIINPRGLRAYVRNDNFFKAIPLVLAKHPNAKFICASMAGESQPAKWIQEVGIAHAVELLPPMPHLQMAETFRRAQIVISPSIHDGTPNSLLEGIACGCFPIAGDLESIREWIIPDENGLLFDSNNPQSIADAIITAIENKPLRKKARDINSQIVKIRAEYKVNMQKIDMFYKIPIF